MNVFLDSLHRKVRQELFPILNLLVDLPFVLGPLGFEDPSVPGPDVAMYGALSAVPINNPKIGFKYEGNTEWIFLVMFSF